MDLALEVLPDYLFVTAVRRRIRALRERDAVARAYYPICRFSVRGETELEPELEDLPEGWVQDYIVFRRRR